MSRIPADRPRKGAPVKSDIKSDAEKPIKASGKAEPAKDPNAPERIAKVLSRAGVASRRDAEQMIAEGRVWLNGKKLDTPAVTVTAKDKITVDGKLLAPPEPPRLWLYHKPDGLVTTARDELGRPTVFEHLPEGLPRVMTVGRLDLNSEGLLLLTNDGELKRKLELPQTGWLRKYRVRVNGRPEEGAFDPLRKGINIEGEQFQPMIVAIDRQQGANAWLTVGIREGRNREIRRAMEAVGFAVNRLIRTSYGPFQLGDLAPGEAEEVRPRMLRDQLGLAETPDARNTPTGPNKARGTATQAQVTTGRLAAKPLPRPTRVITTARSEGADDREDFRPNAHRAFGADRRAEGARDFDKRPARAAQGERAPRSFGNKPAGDFGSRGPKPAYGDRDAKPAFGDRGAKPAYGDRSAKPSYGDRAAKPAYEDRPAKPAYGDRSGKPAFGERGAKPAYGARGYDRNDFDTRPPRPAKPAGRFAEGEGKPRSFGAKPALARGGARGTEGTERSPAEKPARSYGDKPARGFGDKPARSFGDKPARNYDDKPARSFGDKPARSFGDKPARSFDDKPARSFGDKPKAGLSRGGARFGDDKPARTFGAKTGFSRDGDRPSQGGKPSGNRGPRRG